MPRRDPEVERQLADAIRRGASCRPDQTFGDYFRGRSASCALGAAYEGMYRLPDDTDGRRPIRDLEQYFDCLEGTEPPYRRRAGRRFATRPFSYSVSV